MLIPSVRPPGVVGGAPAGPFPVLAGSQTGLLAGQTVHSMALPAGVNVGDMLIAIWTPSGNPDKSSWEAGWTELGAPPLSWPAMRAAYKIADGTEAGQVTFTATSAATAVHATLRITGHDGLAPSVSAYFGSTTFGVDVPALTPAGGAKNYLWLAVGGSNNSGDNAGNLWHTFPTNYIPEINYTAQFYPCVGVARRNLNTAAEDPDSFVNNLDAHDKKAVLLAIGAA